jgi:ATPase subunit of ABC transporter with duplicated ATPase domains
MSFFPGAKIGVLGLNGAGKSTLLRIMAGIDTDIEGEARPQPGIKIGYLPQEPQLNPEHTVRESVEEAVAEVVNALKGLDEVYAKYAEPDADFDKLAAQQGKFEEIIQAHDGHNLNVQLERAADALRLPDWDAKVEKLSGGERRGDSRQPGGEGKTAAAAFQFGNGGFERMAGRRRYQPGLTHRFAVPPPQPPVRKNTGTGSR